LQELEKLFGDPRNKDDFVLEARPVTDSVHGCVYDGRESGDWWCSAQTTIGRGRVVAAFEAFSLRAAEEARADRAYTFLIFRAKSGRLLGGASLAFVRRRAAQSASLGYWIGLPFRARGIMTEAAGMLCRFGFSELGLARIEAACLPENTASIRVLEKCGFKPEGFARGFLEIAVERRDHCLFARLSTDHSG
jgi:ribosomal-protein-alanine N-acetyltransferase